MQGQDGGPWDLSTPLVAKGWAITWAAWLLLTPRAIFRDRDQKVWKGAVLLTRSLGILLTLKFEKLNYLVEPYDCAHFTDRGEKD